MILRKPYAFLIKHFKLIHLILVVFSCYSIYRTNILLEFFNDYILNMVNVIGQDLSTTLIPTFYSLTPIIIIIFTTIILIVMIVKKKPNFFYILNIIIYTFLLIVIFTTNSTLETMSRSLLDVRVIRLTRDLLMISFFLQFISIPILLIRSIGFDIKKFNFKEDLKELEISDEDREEFEVQLNFDRNKIIRNLRKKKRYFIYAYKENKLLFYIITCSVILTVTFIIINNYFVKPPLIEQNVNFSGNGLTLNILDSYLVNTDYKGKILNDNYYLLLKIKVKSNGKIKNTIERATTKIVIGNYYYIPVLGYKDKFIDFGQVYQNEKISNEFEEKILVYEIPKQLINNEMIFSYINKNSFNDKEGFKSTNVKIQYKDLTGINSNNTYLLGQKVEFTDSILSNYKIQLYDYDIKDKFKIEYEYCISNECQKSYDYLMPKLNTNYDKVLLNITGEVETENNISKKYNLYQFIEKFGKICYTIDGTLKTQELNNNLISSNRIKQSNNYYIEVNKEIENASDISIVFTIRDRIYEYKLK